MLHSRNPSNPDGDEGNRDGQDAWSSAFPNRADQHFDCHSFGRMDRPVTPSPFASLPVGTESQASPSRLYDSFVAQSIRTDLLVLGENVLAPPPRHDASRGEHDATSPMRHEESHEMDEFNTPSQPKRLYRNVLPGEITPYLGLRSRLTQIPINRWTILLMLVLARLIILFESLNTNLASAQDEAASACSRVEEIGSAMASMPFYLSVGVNELVAMGITNTLRGLIKILTMILSSLLEILMFIIERTYGTIVCVATSFIKGLIGLAAAAVQDLLQGIEDGLEDIVGGLVSAVNVVATGLDSVVDEVNAFLGAKIPSLDDVQAEVAKLSSHSFINATAAFDSITDFDNKIPNFDGIIADVQAVIGMPFTTVETLLNESFGNWSMDPSVFPIASKETLTFCTGNDTITELFDVLFIIAKSARVIVLTGMLLAALLAAAFMAWFEFQSYRTTVVNSKLLLNREGMDTVYVVARPLTARTGLWISQKVSKDPNRQMLIRWVVAYATTYTALFVLSLAVAGAFSVLCQFFIMRAVQKETPALAQEVGTFVTNAMGALESSSTQWANESNQAVLNLQNDINNKILIHIKDATGAVVTLINTFESDTTTLLENFFGSNPIGVAADNFTETLLNCVIFNALNKVKSGIAWIDEEAQVTLPEFPFDVFSMGATGSSANSSFSTLLTNSGAQTADDVTNALNKVVVMLRSSIVQEGLVALVLFLVYIAYVFFAVAQAALRMCCMKDRRPEDAEKGGYAMKDIQASQDADNEKCGSPKTTRPPSMAPSYRLSNLDISQLARELSIVEGSPSPVKRRSAEVLEAWDVHEEDEDPFGDETYAIGDEEVDGIVGVLHDSREAADISVSQLSQSPDDNPYTIGHEEVDGIVGVLRNSGEMIENSGPRNRQAWVEDAYE